MKRIVSIVMFLLVLIVPGIAMSNDEILIGLIPEENIFTQMERHIPLAEYLSAKSGEHFRFTILSRYGDIIDSFVSRGIDGAFFGVFTSVLAFEKLKVEPIARPVGLDGISNTRSYIIARKDSGINSIADMKGRRAAFVDRATATGYIYALALLKDNGVGKIDNFFSEFIFTGSHDSVINAVLDGRADVGTTKSRIFNRMLQKDPFINEELHILLESPELPDTTLCLRSDMDEDLKDLIRDTLINMHNDAVGREVLAKMGIKMFVPAHSEDFKPVYDLLTSAGINLKEYRYR